MPFHRHHRRLAPVRSGLFALLTLLCCSSSLLAQAAPQLVAAASRKSHAGASYDVALPLAGASGI
ncbi:MAG: hypothetical protein ABIP55_08550 [Tepidisphaeraceae bacterium]